EEDLRRDTLRVHQVDGAGPPQLLLRHPDAAEVRAPVVESLGRVLGVVAQGRGPELHEGVRDAPCAQTLTGTRPSARCRSLPWRSGPLVILPALVAARQVPGLAGRPPQPPCPIPPTRPRRHP